jgi:flagellar protein FlgJ
MKLFAIRTEPLPLNQPIKIDAKALDKAARGFEGLFAQTLIASMRDASFGDPLFGGDSTYRDMYDHQMAEQLSRGPGLGLAAMLRRQLSGTIATTTAIESASPEAPPAQFSLQNYSHPASPPAVAFLPGLPQAMPENFWLARSKQKQVVAPVVAPEQATSVDRGRPAQSSTTPEQFVRDLWPHAQAAAAKLGVSPKALVAQAALETGWGRRPLRNDDGSEAFNLFGIKAGQNWKGEALSRRTTEFHDGVESSENSSFRSYPSIAHSFGDYVELLSESPRYAAAVSAGPNVDRFAKALQQAGYATDPNYAAKISAIVDGPTLRRALDALDPGLVASN